MGVSAESPQSYGGIHNCATSGSRRLSVLDRHQLDKLHGRRCYHTVEARARQRPRWHNGILRAGSCCNDLTRDGLIHKVAPRTGLYEYLIAGQVGLAHGDIEHARRRCVHLRIDSQARVDVKRQV